MKYRQTPLAIIHSGQATKPSLIRSLLKRRGRVGENGVGTERGGAKKRREGRQKSRDRVENMWRMSNESLSLADEYDRKK